MEYMKLGNTGMDVSRICLGCMGFGDAERWIHQWVLATVAVLVGGAAVNGPFFLMERA